MANVTASEFVAALYPEDVAGVVCIARPAKKGFHHLKLDAGLELAGSNYVCVSTVRDAHKLRRRAGDCVTACVVMLDDVGTKVEIPPVPPTAVIETSPGNFQYIYRIEPLALPEHTDYYEACLKELARGGFTDAGSLGISRVYRLPGSVNTKYDEPFTARVTEWNPERVWTLDSLTEEFGVDLTGGEYQEDNPEDYFVPDETDPVLTWLEQQGLVKSVSDGWHVVTCPWEKEHSNSDTTAAYSPLGKGDKPYLRGFKCLHGHCERQRISNFLAWVADMGGPAAESTAPTEDLGKLIQDIGHLTVDERYRLVRSSFPEVNALTLPDLKTAKGGIPAFQQLPTSDNVAHVVDASGVELRFNMQDRAPEFVLRDDEVQKIVPNEHVISRYMLDSCLRLGISNVRLVKQIMEERALDHRFHPMQGWITGRPWDGVHRLPELLATVNVAQDDHDLWPLFLRKWLIQGVQAVCGWDNPQQVGSCLVFAGKTRIGKTRWFTALAPAAYFTPSGRLSLNHSFKDSVMAVTKTPITELGELDSTFSRSDMGAIKAFLTASHDTYRLPYGATVLRLPRTTIFCATVNRIDFLADETGTARFWPVEVTSCTPDHGIDMQQVWAEAHTWWKADEQWWLEDGEGSRLAEHSNYYRVTSSVEEQFAQYCIRTEGQSSNDYVAMNLTMLLDRLGIPGLPQHMGTVRRLIEERFGPRRPRIGGVQNAWYMPDPMRMEATDDA